VTTKTAEDVQVVVHVDLAEAERTLRIGDAFALEHPKVPRDQIVPTREGDAWIVVLDGNHYKLVLLSAEKAAIARVDPLHHDVLLEPAQPVRLPQAPTSPPPPDLVSQAYSFRKICTEALDRFRQDVGAWSDLVAPETDLLTRLRMQYPGITLIPNGQVYNDAGLAELGQTIARVADLGQSVPALEATDRALVMEATAQIRAATIAVNPPTRPTIRTAGESALPNQVTTNLDDVQDQVDKLGRALDELAPTIQQLIATTPDFLDAALLVLRGGVVARGVLFVERECQRLRQGRETGMMVDVEASKIIGRLFLALGRPVNVPAVNWSLTEPWEPPTLQ
jgi:hypothetical protein